MTLPRMRSISLGVYGVYDLGEFKFFGVNTSHFRFKLLTA